MYIAIHRRCIVIYMDELKKVARDITNARQALARAMASAEAATVKAHAEGATEVDIAQHIGVNRMTIRKWLGKL